MSASAMVRPGRRLARAALWQGRRARQQAIRVVIYLLIGGGALFLLIPFAWMVSTSLKRPGDTMIFPPEWIPRPIMWSNYLAALDQPGIPLLRFIRNTVIISVLATAGQVISSSLVAFGFARLRWRGRDLLFSLLIATLFLPSQVTLVPTFLLYRTIGWVDTYLPLIVPAWFGSAFSVFLMRQFFLTIPLDLDDAARIDGCSSLGTFRYILLPLAKPAVGTVAIFSFLYHWNDFLTPLVYLNTQEKYTLALGLRLFQSNFGTRWDLLMAASTMAIVPILLIFALAQRHFVQGIVFTGVKG